MKTSIIIVNYHSRSELFECLKSIYEQRPTSAFEIIVVDNDEEKTIEKDLKKRFSKVIYIKSPGNIGYGAGNNLGAKKAAGEYLFILNPDTKIYSGNIQKLLDLFEKDESIGIIAPLLLNKKNKPYNLQGTRELTPKRAIFSLSFLSRMLPKNKAYKDYYFLGWDKKKLKEVDVIPGTAFIIKKKIYKSLGGFDEKFFLFFEEFDLSKRVREQGFKILISPGLKLVHLWGVSTSKNPKTEKYFKESRFYYFRKNYGLMKAVFTETILRVNKEIGILLIITVIALFLRLYKISEIMSFIPDIGWFYVSARDMITSRQIPLVGIETSHPWLHQGALWTYVLAAVLWISKFNPVAPAYFTSFLDIATIVIIYFTANEMFGRKTALISCFFYATSPLVIYFAQTPYHTSLIPFFTSLVLLSVLKWIKGKVMFFPVTIFLLGLVYNLEIAAFSLVITVFLILIFGLLKKRKWSMQILNRKVMALSVIGFLISMGPMLLYDINHGFSQTFKFLIWVFYRAAVFLGYPPLNPEITGESWKTFFSFTLGYIQRFYFLRDQETAVIILGVLSAFALYKIVRKKYKDLNHNIVFIFFIIPVISYVAAKTNSAAYLPMFLPQGAIIFGIFFAGFKGKLFYASTFVVILISVLNLYQFPKRPYADVSFQKRIQAAREIINKSDKKPYNIIYMDEKLYGGTFTKNYDYLTWYLGHEPSKKNEKLKFYIFEDSSRIKIERANK